MPLLNSRNLLQRSVLPYLITSPATNYDVSTLLGYEISDKNKLVGEAKGEKVKVAIYDFFDDKRNNLDATLVFYYSGHGDLMLMGSASSDTEPDKPYRRRFFF